MPTLGHVPAGMARPVRPEAVVDVPEAGAGADERMALRDRDALEPLQIDDDAVRHVE